MAALFMTMALSRCNSIIAPSLLTALSSFVGTAMAAVMGLVLSKERV